MMEDNVVYLHETTEMDIPPDRVLTAAVGEMKLVVVMGYKTDGAPFFASSTSSGPEVLWLLERLRALILSSAEGKSSEIAT